jgi:hypothetical protein
MTMRKKTFALIFLLAVVGAVSYYVDLTAEVDQARREAFKS